MKPIGILGGLGPEASNKFCEYLVEFKEAPTDQDNLNFIHYCNSKIPSRIDYIDGTSSVSPIPEMVRTCKNLENMGVSCIVVPCNTVHYLLPEVQKEISTPIIDMIQLLVKKIKLDNPNMKKIGVIGTNLTIELKLYEKYLNLVDIELVKLDKEQQNDWVMESIYEIKAGKKDTPKQFLTKAANKLVENGAESLILGCTEIPLVLKQENFDIQLYDPMEVCAKEIIRYYDLLDMENLFSHGVEISPTPAIVEFEGEESKGIYAEMSEGEEVSIQEVNVVGA